MLNHIKTASIINIKYNLIIKNIKINKKCK